MNVVAFFKARIRAWRIYFAQRALLRSAQDEPVEISREDWALSLKDPVDFYLRCLRYFHRQLPGFLRAHRRYFSRAQRGFGEDAFHVMWFLLYREFRPGRCLEIGVYRGQTLSLWALLARWHGVKSELHGISPFTSAGDSVSRYPKRVDYFRDTLRNFDYFGLPHPQLLRAFSTDALAIERIRSGLWDVIYIDGNHDYAVVQQDWEHAAQGVRVGGLVVLDDAGLTTSYQPPLFSSGGHPGPSRVAQELDRGNFLEILQVGHNRVFQRMA